MIKIVGTACNLAFLVWVLAGQPAHASLMTKSLTIGGFVTSASGTGAGFSVFAIDSVDMAPVAR